MRARRAFGYWRDPACVGALGLYLLNRLVLKPGGLGQVSFFRDYFNDVLCIPLFVPLVLLVHRWLGLRPAERWPTAGEVLLHLGVWSVCFEVIAPRVPIYRTTADPLDVVAYALGAAAAGLWWGSWRREWRMMIRKRKGEQGTAEREWRISKSE
jgi:hypothetical protein